MDELGVVGDNQLSVTQMKEGEDREQANWRKWNFGRIERAFIKRRDKVLSDGL